MNTEHVIPEYAAICKRTRHEWYTISTPGHMQCRMCGLVAGWSEKEAWT